MKAPEHVGFNGLDPWASLVVACRLQGAWSGAVAPLTVA